MRAQTKRTCIQTLTSVPVHIIMKQSRQSEPPSGKKKKTSLRRMQQRNDKERERKRKSEVRDRRGDR